MRQAASQLLVAPQVRGLELGQEEPEPTIVVEVDAHLAAVEVSAVAAGSPVREFSWHPRQGNYPGWLWTATTGTLVGYESLLERVCGRLPRFQSLTLDTWCQMR